ncbi:MAG: hypothetical protein AUK47_15695 [Deltaproteobacteria bacterium CG2_30_63_29]|nr:MAG: hypothetical protein AUK47_15695 [Deltaproteobacteria bacterium CG2_30_63_29]PIW01035.1 MAG: hypothetical protein COW42_06135 [Deltaproteobacteria bacterium CG17_big_fil_post_rev_8_21_14_2_50_63_7]
MWKLSLIALTMLAAAGLLACGTESEKTPPGDVSNVDADTVTADGDADSDLDTRPEDTAQSDGVEVGAEADATTEDADAQDLPELPEPPATTWETTTPGERLLAVALDQVGNVSVLVEKADGRAFLERFRTLDGAQVWNRLFDDLSDARLLVDEETTLVVADSVAATGTGTLTQLASGTGEPSGVGTANVSPADIQGVRTLSFCYAAQDETQLTLVYEVVVSSGGLYQHSFKREVRERTTLAWIEDQTLTGRRSSVASPSCSAQLEGGSVFHLTSSGGIDPSPALVDFATGDVTAAVPFPAGGLRAVTLDGVYNALTATVLDVPGNANSARTIWRVRGENHEVPPAELFDIEFTPSVAGRFKDALATAISGDGGGSVFVGGYGQRNEFEPFDRVWTIIRLDALTGELAWEKTVEKTSTTIDTPLFMGNVGGYLLSVGDYHYDPTTRTTFRIEKRRASDGFLK